MKTVGRIFTFIFGVLMIISGFYCLFHPAQMYLATVGIAVGIAMLFDGCGRFSIWMQARKLGMADGWMLFGAIISIVFGCIVLGSEAMQLGIDAFIIYYIAIWLIVMGIVVICRAFKLHKVHKNWDTAMLGTRWYLPLLLGILMILFGILCVCKPGVLAASIGILIGLGVISAGANLITMAVTPDPIDVARDKIDEIVNNFR